MSGFAPGIQLSRAFYDEVVASLVEVPHAAALLGSGSEVLGFDTARSTDHGWGPRLQIFVDPADAPRVRQAIDDGLPDEFWYGVGSTEPPKSEGAGSAGAGAGKRWPTRFGWDDVPVSHHVQVVTARDWLLDHLGFDPRDGIAVWEWLGTPQQVLLEVTEGAVFHDENGDLAAVRKALAWYPDDVWLWMLACQWRRIDQEEPFVGRAAEVGDELGSRIIAARLVREIMRLCFLLERRYAPYSKWLGSAFGRLQASDSLSELLRDTLAASDYPAREAALVEGVQRLAGLHNALGMTTPVEEGVGLFHNRPFRVLGSARFVDACLDEVSDPILKSLPLIGSIDQFVDSTDVLAYPRVFRPAAALYESVQRS